MIAVRLVGFQQVEVVQKPTELCQSSQLLLAKFSRLDHLDDVIEASPPPSLTISRRKEPRPPMAGIERFIGFSLAVRGLARLGASKSAQRVSGARRHLRIVGHLRRSTPGSLASEPSFG